MSIGQDEDEEQEQGQGQKYDQEQDERMDTLGLLGSSTSEFQSEVETRRKLGLGETDGRTWTWSRTGTGANQNHMEPNDQSCEERDQVGAQYFHDYEDDELEDEDQGRVSRVGLNYVAEPIMDASFQDDFDDIHSDYQWFTESGFAVDATNLDVGNFPTPLCIGVGTDLEFDATMAHIDMEDFQSQDILLRFPPLSASDLQPHQGETIASITGSILQQFDFESSMTPNSHSVEDDQHQSMDMSICKSENLFSPVAENQQHLPLSTFSTDSLDARGETILATCMTNRNNYTIAFQGLELEESTTSSTYRTAHDNNLISPASDMTENEMTNWRQLKTSNDNGNRNNNKYSKNNASDNNNGSNTGSSETNSEGVHHSYIDTRSLLTQSCPNPWFWKKNSLVFNNNNPKIQTAAFVKLFDIHMSRPGLGKDSNSMTESNVHMMTTGSGSGGSGNGSRLDNASSAAGTGSTGSSARGSGGGGYMMEESWNNNRNPNPNPFRIRTKFEKARPTTTTQIAEAIKKSRSIQIQTSTIKLKPKRKEGEFTPHSTPKKTSPVFVCFPSYTLPDLKFLQKRSLADVENDEMGLPEVYLLPQKYKVPTRPKKSEAENCGNGGNARGSRGRRPMSCNDIEDLRKRDLSHVRDWPSLNFLLPQEYQSILEVMKPLEKREQSDETEKERDACVPVAAAAPTSDILTENNEPVILRKKPGRNHQRGSAKRFSLNDTGSPGRNDRGFAEKFKRFSLQETLPEVAEITTEIAKNLEQLESLANHLGNDFPGGIDSNENFPQEQTESSDSCGHHHNRRVPNNTPKHASYVDFDNHFKTLEEGAAKMVAHIAPMCSLGTSPTKHNRVHVDMAEKQSLTDGIASAVTQIQASWTPPSATTMDNRLVKGSGGRNLTSYPNLMIMSQSPGGRMVLETLCPALYSLLSDGLCPFLETIFGRVPNTVWRVVEASIQYGPTAQTLNELVLRINSEELLAEGPMKLNAFVCGLLNLGNLGSWLTFLRTKERLLRTHYDTEAFMFLCNTSTRFLYDQMLVNMHLLSRLPFQLDIFHETKLLHQSMNPSFMSNKSNHTLPVLRKNSTKGSSRNSAAPNVRKSTSADARIPKPQSKNSKYFANQLKKSQMKRSFSDERPKINKTPSTLPKSKTAQNIQNERQYSSSGVPKPTSYGLARFPSKPKISAISAEAASDREKGMEPTKAQRPKSIEGDGLTETNKDPDRFRRLQMQWELLSSDDSRKTTSPVSGVPNSTNPALAGSKIPRPITSPIRTYHPGLPGSGPNVRPTSRR